MWPGCLEKGVCNESQRSAPNDVGGDHHRIALAGLLGRSCVQTSRGEPAEVARAPHAQTVGNACRGSAGGRSLAWQAAERGAHCRAVGKVIDDRRDLRLLSTQIVSEFDAAQGLAGDLRRRQRLLAAPRQPAMPGDH